MRETKGEVKWEGLIKCKQWPPSRPNGSHVSPPQLHPIHNLPNSSSGGGGMVEMGRHYIKSARPKVTSFLSHILINWVSVLVRLPAREQGRRRRNAGKENVP